MLRFEHRKVPEVELQQWTGRLERLKKLWTEKLPKKLDHAHRV